VWRPAPQIIFTMVVAWRARSVHRERKRFVASR